MYIDLYYNNIIEAARHTTSSINDYKSHSAIQHKNCLTALVGWCYMSSGASVWSSWRNSIILVNTI